MDLLVSPGGTLQGEWVLPGDKSISHRALILGAIAEGDTHIDGFLHSEDCLATLEVLAECGVKFSLKQDTVVVHGRGRTAWHQPDKILDCQNSGTSLRLLTGLFSAMPFTVTLTGDLSLRGRPMKRIVEPLQQMGSTIEAHSIEEQLYAPLTITGQMFLKNMEYTLPVPSAQVKSGLLLAALMAETDLILHEPIPTRDHTERMLSAFGANIQMGSHTIRLAPTKTLRAQHIHVPGDISSAAFFIVAASVLPGSHLLLRNVGMNPTRTGILLILRAMGADIRLHRSRCDQTEPVADIEIKSAILHGIDVPQEWVVPAIDEFPIIFVAAALAQGKTTIRGLSELRVKETDRLAVMANELKKLGAHLHEWADGIEIEGGELSGGVVDSQGDHRIAMAFSMAALVAKAPIIIQHADNIATSFPGFVDFAVACGLKIEENEENIENG